MRVVVLWQLRAGGLAEGGWNVHGGTGKLNNSELLILEQTSIKTSERNTQHSRMLTNENWHHGMVLIDHDLLMLLCGFIHFSALKNQYIVRKKIFSKKFYPIGDHDIPIARDFSRFTSKTW